MSIKPVTVLRRARKLIADPSAWVKGAFKRKRKGIQCYCAQGALAAAAGIHIVDKDTLSDEVPGGLPSEYYAAHLTLRKALTSLGHDDWVPRFNDNPKTDHADVLAAFDRAIELAKAAFDRAIELAKV
jgi:hypothetical protein